MLKQYTRGMAMCEAALYDVSARSRVTIQCTSESGRLLEIEGDLYRRIRQQESTLNEDVDMATFLKMSGYYEDQSLLPSSAATYKVCARQTATHRCLPIVSAHPVCGSCASRARALRDDIWKIGSLPSTGHRGHLSRGTARGSHR